MQWARHLRQKEDDDLGRPDLCLELVQIDEVIDVCRGSETAAQLQQADLWKGALGARACMYEDGNSRALAGGGVTEEDADAGDELEEA